MAILSIAKKRKPNRQDIKRITRYTHPILAGNKLENDWRWDNLSKSECVTLDSDNKNACFFENPYSISRGTAGKHYRSIIWTDLNFKPIFNFPRCAR